MYPDPLILYWAELHSKVESGELTQEEADKLFGEKGLESMRDPLFYLSKEDKARYANEGEMP